MKGGRRLALIALLMSMAACGNPDQDAGPVPRPLADANAPAPDAAPSPREQARVIAGNPRLLLFDLQTALESVRETRGSYPSVDEFQATEPWALQRAALDAGFSDWAYESDGESYTLSGDAGGRTFEIHSP